MPSKLKIIKTESELNTLISFCKRTRIVSIDFETDGRKFHDSLGEPTILGVSFQPGSSWIIPLAHKDSVFKDKFIRIFRKFGKAVLEDKDIVKVGWNNQYELKWCFKYGIYIRGRLCDGMLAKYLLDEERPSDLKSMVARFIPEFEGYDLKGQPNEKAGPEQMIKYWSNVPLEELSKYCGLDSDLTLRLYLYFEKLLIEKGFYPLFRNLLMMAVRVLAESSYQGMVVDREYLSDLKIKYAQLISDTQVSLRSIPRFKRYEIKRLRRVKKTLLRETQDEIDALEEAYDEASNTREKSLISRRKANLERKLEDYNQSKYTTKKDQERFLPFNFGSPKQLIDLLYTSKNGFRLPIIKYTKNKDTKQETDTPATGEDVLLELQHKDEYGFIKYLLKSRELEKLNSTYIVGMAAIVSEHNRIHTSYLIHGTVTGRLSSRGPNLQNIPRTTTNADIKKMFVPPKGFIMLELDYSQAELRVVAELSRDKSMVEMFQKGHNIHVATAAKSMGITYEELYPITKDENHPKHVWATKAKKRAKTINFGVLYGQTSNKLSETLSDAMGEPVSKGEAQKFLDDWYKAFPGVKKWINNQHKYAHKHGYVYNIFGRKRRLPDIDSPNYGIMAEAERQSVNAPIQGSSSDFTQFSSVLIRDMRLKGELPEYLTQVYTVHDSIGFYVKPQDIHEIVEKLVPLCANPQTMKWFGFKMKLVNMKVSVELGRTWAEYHEYDKALDYNAKFQDVLYKPKLDI